MNSQPAQSVIDERNRAFWDELCGSSLARLLGIADESPDSLERFDRAYMEMYPYLRRYVDGLEGRKVLEIGPGYGTVAQRLAEQGAEYHGVDIAPGPVEIVNRRLRLAGRAGGAIVGSALALPFEEASFDVVISIGCLHHTGDMDRAVEEIHRVLRPGGTAVVMCYNRNSLRQWRSRPLRMLREWLFGERGGGADAASRARCDVNARGEPAPFTELCSRWRLEALFRRFTDVRLRRENMDDLYFRGRRVAPRERLLGNLARWVGLDWYVTARKPRAPAAGARP
jgi:SAM-dependent methyltransferase